MHKSFKEVFVSSLITGLISLVTFYFGLKLYTSNEIRRNEINKINEVNKLFDEKNEENSKLKKEIEYLKTKDSLDRLKKAAEDLRRQEKINDEIISYTSLVLKSLSSSKEKDLKTLKSYERQLNEYYNLKDLSDEANRFLISSLRLVKAKKQIEFNNY